MGSSTGAEGLAPHAAVLPIPTLGHITPFLHLSRALASRGFVITFINTEGNHRDLKDIVSQEESFGSGGSIRFETVPGVQTSEADFTAPETRPMFFEALMAMQGPVESLLVRSMARDDDLVPPVSCFISDMLFPWSTEVPRRIGIPEVKFWVASASCVLLYSSYPQMLEKGDIPVQDFSMDKSIEYVRGLSPLPVWSLPRVFAFRDDPSFTRRYERLKNIPQNSWFLANTFEELEGGALEAVRDYIPRIIPIGPAFLSSPSMKNASLWKEDNECLAWLNEQEEGSVLYIAFGSIATLSLEQAKEIAAGLEELQRPFLWGIRPKSVPGMEPEFLEPFKERVRSFGRVITWAPQREVLQHASIGGFFTHCGWNSVLESMAAGVPMICHPCVAEQNLNCKLVVEDWKIGLRYSNVGSGKLVVRDEFQKVVKKLMEDDNGIAQYMRSNAKKLSEEARKAVCVGGSSYQNLENFILSLK
ncbi:hypothetical protein SELMODRAFT_95938 [Selaginella moellendorffii]|uniref:Glycosyltransferase n=1 Tax=Selaginella moellendorffii TaxID=88036 RepID=D8RK33_SELML|nr:hypothetical protein SELMODRAFT_95938 [Selaginella moellendorffii]